MDTRLFRHFSPCKRFLSLILCLHAATTSTPCAQQQSDFALVVGAGPIPPSLDASQPPGRNFDLSHWYLGLPDAGASSISHEDLTEGYTHPAWFYTGADGAMTFFAPVTGGTTPNSPYPRSELREQIDPGNNDVNWPAFGTHTLTAQCRVIQLPGTPKVIIGQIHSKTGEARPLVKLQYNDGVIEALIKDSPTAPPDTVYEIVEAGMHDLITYEIKMVDGLVSVTVNGVTRSVNVFANDPEWADQRFYFKAGSYCQDNTGVSTEGSRVAFYYLVAAHSDSSDVAPSITRQPASQNVVAGANVSFNVAATGTAPLEYQWRFDGADLGDGGNISGSETATLTISNVQASQAGAYSVVVANGVGGIASADAVLNIAVVLTLAEALDDPAPVWRTGGNRPWLAQTTVTRNGDAAQSGTVGHSQESWLETTVTGPGTLAFWWKVSSESSNDRLRLMVNGTQALQISGEVDWQPRTLDLGSGTQTLRWRYTKNGSLVRGQDRAWVDQVAFGQLPPTITAQPASQTVDAGTTVAFSLTASGTPPFAYQWQFNGTNLTNGANLAGATTARLVLTNVQLTHAGRYTCLLTNSAGTAVTAQAELTVNPIVTLDEALDSLTWRTGGALLWSGQAAVTSDAIDAGRSGAVTHGQESWCETVVTGPGAFSFFWKVSSQTNSDPLRFYSNGVQRLQISGEVDWRRQTVLLGPGTHTLRFRYNKNSSTTVGQDRGWLDAIQFAPPAPPAPDTNAPAAVTNLSVASVTATGVMLRWFAAGDDGNTGAARNYDIRYSILPVDEATWGSATSATGEPTPALAGTTQTFLITGLTPGTQYFFALTSADETNNVSPLSNVACATTATNPPPPATSNPTNLVALNATWKYLDNGSDQSTAWRAVDFDDSQWHSGPAQLGYGDGDEATIISFGPDDNNTHMTSYFRRSFTITEPTAYASLLVRLLRNDGAVVYLNGAEVFRSNMPTGAITYRTAASGGADETTFYSAALPASHLVAGINTIAVEVHQKEPGSSDLSFTLQLTGVLR